MQCSDKLTAFGQTKTIREWAESRGIPESTIMTRPDRYGKTPEQALDGNYTRVYRAKSMKAQARRDAAVPPVPLPSTATKPDAEPEQSKCDALCALFFSDLDQATKIQIAKLMLR